jgi:N-acetylneuraminate synthase
MEFSEAQWQGLKKHADENGLLFLSSPFSVEAVELLKRVGVAAWKIASGEVSTPLMLESMAETQLPILLSTGMSSLEEIDDAVARVKARKLPLAVMQCTSRYPCPPEKVGLNLLQLFRDRYASAVGLSDHSGTIYPALAAATIGINVLEVHVTLSREMFGPDVPASVTTDEMRKLIDGIRFIESMKANPIDKDEFSKEAAPLRATFMKSVVAGADLHAGTVLSGEHLAVKKAGAGMAATKFDEVVGRRLSRDKKADELITESDLEGPQ